MSMQRMRATREAKGLGLREAARQMGIDPSALSRIERGLARPTLDQLLRIARVLDLHNVTETIDKVVETRPR